MSVKTLMLSGSVLPEVITKIAHPPKRLYMACENWQELVERPAVAIVGSRKISPYGRSVTHTLSAELAQSGVVVVSGLALGVDAIAHRAALEAGGLTIAVLPGSLERIYPASHRNLANRILERGGALITEYDSEDPIFPANFIARNRLVSGFSRAVLVTEAAEKSGTLHTARFALEQGRDVLAVPGNITSPLSAGTNNLIKAGAIPVTSALDILHYLGLQPLSRIAPTGGTSEEQVIIDLIAKGLTDGGQLLEQSSLEVSIFNQSLTMLEISGKIRCLGANQWSLS